jgi:glycosyltransferase involved in cell wall biosynthesis
VADRVPARARIAHVITESNLGGAQRNTLLSLQGLLAAGLDVELICGPGGPLPEEARASGAVAHLVPELVRPVDPVRDLRALVAIHRLCRQRRYAIVHTHCTKAGWLGRAAAWGARVPVIVHTIHGAPFELARDARTRVFLTLERLAARVTHRLVCVGETFRRHVAGWGIAPEDKLITIYSGVDFGAHVPRRAVAETKRALGLEDAWPIVGCVGRLTEAKALHYLIEAVAGLRHKYPRLRLLLVGDGPLRPALQAVSQRLGCAEAVDFLGERDDVADLLPTFDVYAMSSRWEGVGRAMTEAMLAGLPVVATDVGGVGELVIDGRTGLVRPPGDPGALATAIDLVISDRDLALGLGTAGRERARELMGADRMVDDLCRLYTGLLAHAESRGRHTTPGPRMPPTNRDASPREPVGSAGH